MKHDDKIINNVEAAMNSLDGLLKREANPYLFAKIQHRMMSRRQAGASGKWMYRLALALLLLLVVNIYSYTSFVKTTDRSNTGKSGIEAFAAEYNIQPAGDNI